MTTTVEKDPNDTGVLCPRCAEHKGKPSKIYAVGKIFQCRDPYCLTPFLVLPDPAEARKHLPVTRD